MTTSPGSAAAIRTLRRGLLGVAVLSVLATGYELAAERHWNGVAQLVPWAVLVVLVIAIGLAFGANRVAVALARALAGVALLACVFGMYEHIEANYQAGVLDQTYSDSWENRSELSRWLLAATKTVGPAPPLAPGALGQSALLILLATLGRRRPARPGTANQGVGVPATAD